MASKNSSDTIPMGKAIAIILAVVIGVVGLIGGGLYIIVSGGINFTLGGDSVKDQIIGKWANTESGFYGSIYIFSTDGTYAHSLDGSEEYFSDSVISEETGTYKVSGKTITLQPTTDKPKSINFVALEDDGDTLVLDMDMSEDGNYGCFERY